MPNFTAREYDVLELVLKGMNNYEIAEALTIELSTVKAHLTSIYRKLEVKNRVQAIVKCLMLFFSDKINYPEDILK